MHRAAFIFGLSAAVVTAAVGQEREAKPHLMLDAEELTWALVPVLPSGALRAVLSGDPREEGRLYTTRYRLPDGYVFPPHWHPQDEHVLILAGVLHVGIGETYDRAATRPMREDSYILMPAETPHFAWAEGEVVMQLWGVGPLGIVYVDPADDPRNANDARTGDGLGGDGAAAAAADRDLESLRGNERLAAPSVRAEPVEPVATEGEPAARIATVESVWRG